MVEQTIENKLEEFIQQPVYAQLCHTLSIFPTDTEKYCRMIDDKHKTWIVCPYLDKNTLTCNNTTPYAIVDYIQLHYVGRERRRIS